MTRSLAAALVVVSALSLGCPEEAIPPETTNPCDDGPCFPGVTCTPDGEDGFACGACPAGTEGDGIMCLDQNGCAGDPCFPMVACTDVPAPDVGFECGPCPTGFAGDGVSCEDIDGCADAPCFPMVTCTDVPAPNVGFECGSCPMGYEGDGITCSDVDGCLGDPCFPGVACTDVPAPGTGFQCGPCPPGLEGDGVVCTEIDGCAGEPCLPGTTCTDIPAPETGFTCSVCEGPECPILRALAGGDLTVIAGDPVTLGGNAVGFNGAFSCRWTNDQDATEISTCNATVTPLVDTIYTLTVTDASGLTATDDRRIFVFPFLAEAGVDTNLLFGQTATLSASWDGASCADDSCIRCQWSLSDGTPVASTCSATVSPAATTQYFEAIEDTGSGDSHTDSLTVFVTDVEAQVCGWNVVVLRQRSYPTSGNPNYICDDGGTARVQTVNGKPAIVRSDLVVRNTKIVGRIGVETGGDDDLIGFLWGFQDATHFYMLLWKQNNQNFCGAGRAGIAVKKVDLSTTTPDSISFEPAFGFNATDHAYECNFTWSGARSDEPSHDPGVTFLTSPDDTDGFRTGWRDFITYRFEFFYTPTRTKILVYEDDQLTGSTADLVHEFVIVDSSFPSGSFAFLSNSQAQVNFGDFTLASLDFFRADAGPDQTVASGTPVTLAASAELAVPPILCEWSVGPTLVGSTCDLEVTPSTTTTYTLMVTDDFGRVQTDDVVITVTP